MAAVIQTISTTSMSLNGPWTETFTTISTTGRVLIGMSKDRTTLYARTTGTSPANRSIVQSIDDGVTWTNVHTFSDSVEGMTFLDDGEVLAILQGSSAAPGYIYRSTGWTTNPATATWTLTMTTRGGYIRSIWGANRWASSGSRVVVSEYGGQSQSADAIDSPEKYATQAYLSEDYGRTWRPVLDLTTLFPGTYNFHCHAVAYDSFWDRIWVTYGDINSHLNNTQTNIMYSDDLGSSWVTVPLPPYWTGQTSAPFQDTTIFIGEKSIGFMPDGIPYAPSIIARKGYRVMGDLIPGPLWAGNTGAQGISQCAYKAFPQAGKSAPLFLSNQGLVNQVVPATVYMSPDGNGENWVEIFRVTGSSAVDTINYVAGPTVNNYVLFSQGVLLYRAKLLKPLTDVEVIS